jgi:hypothetical protein
MKLDTYHIQYLFKIHGKQLRETNVTVFVMISPKGGIIRISPYFHISVFAIFSTRRNTFLNTCYYYYYYYWWDWGLKFAFAKQALYHLNHTSSPFCCGYFGDGVLKNYFPGLASNQDPPDLNFPK